MPYDNLPESAWGRMDKCVEKVIAQGHDKQSAIAICYTSIASKEAAPQFTVFKQANGDYRWLMVSSNAYRDNDGEIVSLKAQEADVARMEATRDYGPLRWWHVPGLDIGTCDFAATHGRMRVESGVFATKEIGANVARQASGLAVSLGFTHSAKEPDGAGVYHHINVFERSLLPKTKAANPYTFVSVQKELAMASLKEKLGEFAKTVFGGDAAKAEQFAAKIETAQKEIELAGVAFKEKTLKADEPPLEEGDGEEEGDVLLSEATEEELKDALAAKMKEATMKAGGKSGPAERDAMFADMHDKGTYDESALSGGGSHTSGGKRVPNRQRTSFRKGKKKKELDDELTIGDLTTDEFQAVMTDWFAPVTKELGEVRTLKERESTTLKEALDTIEQLKARLDELEGGRSRADVFRASKSGPEPKSITPPGTGQREKEINESGEDWFVRSLRS